MRYFVCDLHKGVIVAAFADKADAIEYAMETDNDVLERTETGQ